jgi:hypothetical protein
VLNTPFQFVCFQIDLTGKYDNVVHICGFNPHFTLAGGINLPKIITCIGSDGVARRQLVKVCSQRIVHYFYLSGTLAILLTGSIYTVFTAVFKGK